MRIIKRTNKKLPKEVLENLIGIKNYSKKDKILAEIQLPFESEIAQNNVNYINKNLCETEEIMDYLIESDVDELDILPVLIYREYLGFGLEYKTMVKDGKIRREVFVNDALKEVTTRYDVAFDIFDVDSNEDALMLRSWVPGAALDIYDYESIFEVVPEIVKKLLENGFVEIVEYEETEGGDD